MAAHSIWQSPRSWIEPPHSFFSYSLPFKNKTSRLKLHLHEREFFPDSTLRESILHPPSCEVSNAGVQNGKSAKQALFFRFFFGEKAQRGVDTVPSFIYTYWDVFSMKGYVEWVLANQRSERCFSHMKKKRIRPIRSANDISSCVREMIRPMKSQSDVWVSRQNSCLLHVQATQDFAHIQRENLYVEAIKQSFNRRKVKSETSCKLKWNSLVYFTVNKINVESRQNNSRRGKTEGDANWQEQGWKFYLLLVLAVVLTSMHGLCLYSICYTVITVPSSPWFLF